MRYVQTYLITVAIILITEVSVFAWLPGYRIHLIAEDRLIENLSALFYLCTFSLSTVYYFKTIENRKMLLTLSATCLLGFADELSLLDLLGIDVFGTPIDALHDLFHIGHKAIQANLSTYPSISYALVAACSAGPLLIFAKHRETLIGRINNSHHRQTYILLLVFAALIASALVIDLDTANNDALVMLEEAFEMNASIALFFCYLSLRNTESPMRASGSSSS